MQKKAAEIYHRKQQQKKRLGFAEKYKFLLDNFLF
jgi:hypothetical protein